MAFGQGVTPWDADIDATTHRLRPIVLTAPAASLGMIPIAPEVFWGWEVGEDQCRP
jgi:multidrug efflux pump